MKFLVLATCLSLSTAAGIAGIAAPAYPGYAAGYGYAGPLNLNTQLVGHPNGAVVPLDEPAVAAARADHFAAGGGRVNAAPIAVAPAIAAPTFAAPAIAAPAVAAGYGYAGPLNLNTQLVGHPNGAVVPLDEPAVAAARADHFAAGGGRVHAAPIVSAPAIAAPVVAAPAIAAGYGYAGPLNLNTQLVGHPNGAVVPLDEPAVAAARADHFAAGGGRVHAAPIVAAPVIAAPAIAAGYGYAGPLNLNTQLVGHPNGAVVPLDEPAVAAARADHFAAGGGRVHAAPIVAAPAIAAPAIAAGYGYAGPLNLNTQLVGHPNGAVVPLDEPAVAAARADHFAAGGGRVHAAPIVAAPAIAAPAIAGAGYNGYAAGYGGIY